jgi:hypothetical protein
MSTYHAMAVRLATEYPPSPAGGECFLTPHLVADGDWIDRQLLALRMGITDKVAILTCIDVHLTYPCSPQHARMFRVARREVKGYNRWRELLNRMKASNF